MKYSNPTANASTQFIIFSKSPSLIIFVYKQLCYFIICSILTILYF